MSQSIRINCSFCGRQDHETARMVAGPTVYICSECIENCADILADGADRRRRRYIGEVEYQSWFAAA